MAAYAGMSPVGDSLNHKTDPNSNHSGQVNFSVSDEYPEERKKYLTAKYGQHQMKLIRKRLAVEDWVDKQLRILYQVVSLPVFKVKINLSL